MANPVLGDALCGAVARLFKYLIPAYCEEFAANLRHWVGTSVSEDALSTDNVLQPHERPDHGLRSLYGPLVFPESLVNILNCNVLELKHVCEDADMMPTLAKFKGSVYMILYRLLLQHEDKPVQTRFWTFASCVGRLALAKILHIPPDVFGTYFVQPREQIFPGHRIPIRITSLSDNSGTERRSNKLFTMKYPQCLFVEKLYLLSPTFFMKIIVETFCSLAMCLFIRVGMLAVRSVDDIL